MTEAETIARFREFQDKRHALERRIITQVRGIVPVLHDHQLHACAKPLDELLFELDAMDQELQTFILSDLEHFMAVIMPKP